MMMTLLSEASFLGFEGIEATALKTFFAMAAFGILLLFANVCKNDTKTIKGEKICSVIEWINVLAIVICGIIEIVCAIKIF